MKIVVDVMGSDLGPEPLIKGGIKASKENIGIIFVGKKEKIEEILEKEKVKNLPIEFVHADEEVQMDDSPSKVVKSKPNSSMAVGLNLLKDNKASAFISAGNTGAVLAYSIFILKRLKNILRPAIAATFPTKNGYSTLLDVGGNVNCKPEHLVQFAIMGSVFSKIELGIKNPRVALLSNGEEESKGIEILKKAHYALKKSSINYIGFKEGRDIFEGNADVFVCDGFVGNICLKLTEGIGKTLFEILKHEFQSSLSKKIGAFLLKKVFLDIKRKLDYREYGAAPLIGVKGIVMISHGSSDDVAIYNAIKKAKVLVDKQFNLKLSKEIEKNRDLETTIWKSIKEKIFHKE